MAKEYKAEVVKFVPDGRHGPYAVARCGGIGSVTLSLSPPAWNEDGIPEKGTMVVLSDVRKLSAGWRATSGRFLRPEDEKSEKD